MRRERHSTRKRAVELSATLRGVGRGSGSEPRVGANLLRRLAAVRPARTRHRLQRLGLTGALQHASARRTSIKEPEPSSATRANVKP